jgi:hypothetical protein
VKYAKDKQVARCGNAVPPPFAEALVRANLPGNVPGSGGRIMAKSSAEKGRAASAAICHREPKIELVLDVQELGMLARNCAARRPGRDAYEMAEYIALLIRQDDAGYAAA